MKLLNSFIVILIIFSMNSVKGNEIEMQNKITKNLRCLICQGQSVFDSDSDFAISLKLVVKNKIDEGLVFLQISRGAPSDRDFVYPNPDETDPTVVLLHKINQV